jgi:hypothetical protein
MWSAGWIAGVSCAVAAGRFTRREADRVVPEGAVVVLSDNPIGADSRIWGYIPEDSIVGLVLRHR